MLSHSMFEPKSVKEVSGNRGYPLVDADQLKSEEKLSVPASIIKSSLDLYRSEFIYCRSATFTKYELCVEATVDSYQLAQPGLLRYVTAPLLMLLISQAGYIFLASYAAKVVRHSKFPEMDLETFKKVRNAGGVLISRIQDVKFHRKIELPRTMKLQISAHRVRQTTSAFMTRTGFDLENGAAIGRFDTVLSLPNANKN